MFRVITIFYISIYLTRNTVFGIITPGIAAARLQHDIVRHDINRLHNIGRFAHVPHVHYVPIIRDAEDQDDILVDENGTPIFIEPQMDPSDRSAEAHTPFRPGSNIIEGGFNSMKELSGMNGPMMMGDNKFMNGFQDGPGPNQFMNGMGPNKFMNEMGPNKFMNEMGPNKFMNEMGPNKFMNGMNGGMMGPNKFGNQIGGILTPNKLGNQMGGIMEQGGKFMDGMGGQFGPGLFSSRPRTVILDPETGTMQMMEGRDAGIYFNADGIPMPREASINYNEMAEAQYGMQNPFHQPPIPGVMPVIIQTKEPAPDLPVDTPRTSNGTDRVPKTFIDDEFDVVEPETFIPRGSEDEERSIPNDPITVIPVKQNGITNMNSIQSLPDLQNGLEKSDQNMAAARAHTFITDADVVLPKDKVISGPIATSGNFLDPVEQAKPIRIVMPNSEPGQAKIEHVPHITPIMIQPHPEDQYARSAIPTFLGGNRLIQNQFFPGQFGGSRFQPIRTFGVRPIQQSTAFAQTTTQGFDGFREADPVVAVPFLFQVPPRDEYNTEPLGESARAKRSISENITTNSLIPIVKTFQDVFKNQSKGVLEPINELEELLEKYPISENIKIEETENGPVFKSQFSAHLPPDFLNEVDGPTVNRTKRTLALLHLLTGPALLPPSHPDYRQSRPPPGIPPHHLPMYHFHNAVGSARSAAASLIQTPLYGFVVPPEDYEDNQVGAKAVEEAPKEDIQPKTQPGLMHLGNLIQPYRRQRVTPIIHPAPEPVVGAEAPEPKGEVPNDNLPPTPLMVLRPVGRSRWSRPNTQARRVYFVAEPMHPSQILGFSPNQQPKPNPNRRFQKIQREQTKFEPNVKPDSPEPEKPTHKSADSVQMYIPDEIPTLDTQILEESQPIITAPSEPRPIITQPEFTQDPKETERSSDPLKIRKKFRKLERTQKKIFKPQFKSTDPDELLEPQDTTQNTDPTLGNTNFMSDLKDKMGDVVDTVKGEYSDVKKCVVEKREQNPNEFDGSFEVNDLFSDGETVGNPFRFTKFMQTPYGGLATQAQIDEFLSTYNSVGSDLFEDPDDPLANGLEEQNWEY